MSVRLLLFFVTGTKCKGDTESTSTNISAITDVTPRILLFVCKQVFSGDD